MRAFAFALAINLCGTGEAARVASLNLCTDALVLALADPASVVSVTHLVQDPRESAAWRKARRYPANDGSILSVAQYRPELIVTMGGGGRDGARLAGAIGARFLDLPFPTRLRDVEQNIVRLAAALDRPAQGRALARTIAALRASMPARQRPAIFIDRSARSLSPIGAGADWMRLAGYRQLPLPGDRTERETMARMPPVTLLLSNYRTDQYSRTPTSPLRRPQDRQIITDGRRWTCMGPDLVPEILRLRRAA